MLLLTAHAVRAQDGAMVIGNQGSYTLSRAFMVLEDRSGALTLDEVLPPAQQACFSAVSHSGSATNFGLTPSAFWLRIELLPKAGAPASWLLEVAYPALDQFELYVQAAGGGFVQSRGRDLLPFASRVVPHRNHVLPRTLQAGLGTMLYLRVQSQGTLSAPAPVRLWQAHALSANDQGEYALLSMYFGLPMLRQIFGNLLSCAVSYSPNGGQVLFRVHREGHDVVLDVSDEGIGIPQDELAHLFESFHRANDVGSNPGTGLGLAIVKNAVTAHGGTIVVTSRARLGTSFAVRLPVLA